MKHSTLAIALITFSLTACDQGTADKVAATPPAQKEAAPWATLVPESPALPPSHPVINANDAAMAVAQTEIKETETGTVISSVNVQEFTYIEVKQGQNVRWLASQEIYVEPGATIKFDSGSTMNNFESKVLERSFPQMTFVNSVSIAAHE
jgi:hypothetical protein